MRKRKKWGEKGENENIKIIKNKNANRTGKIIARARVENLFPVFPRKSPAVCGFFALKILKCDFDFFKIEKIVKSFSQTQAHFWSFLVIFDLKIHLAPGKM